MALGSSKAGTLDSHKQKGTSVCVFFLFFLLLCYIYLAFHQDPKGKLMFVVPTGAKTDINHFFIIYSSYKAKLYYHVSLLL